MAHYGARYDSPPAYEYGNQGVPHGRGGARDQYHDQGYHDDRGRGRGRDRDRDRDYDDGYYSDDYHDRRPARPGPGRRKSTLQRAMSLGKKGAAALAASQALSGGGGGGGRKSRSRSRGRGRHDDYDSYGSYGRSGRSRSRARYGDGRSYSHPRTTQQKWQQVVQAAVMAGAVEAYRSRKEPGSWKGEKGQRVLTAAIGAAGVDGLVDRSSRRNSKKHMAEAVIGGLAANRFANGPRSHSRDGRGRSRRSASRGRSRSLSDFLRGR